VFVAESASNPDESRLRQHLTDKDLTTTPVTSADETIEVTLDLYIRTLIELVKFTSVDID